MASSADDMTLNNIPKLKDATSFPLWDLEINVMFMAKGLSAYVSGGIAKPEREKISEWEQKDALAKYFILRTIDINVKTHILTCETSKQMYDTLTKIYQKNTDQQKTQLLGEFYNFEYDKNLDVMSNIAKVQTLAFRLNRLGQNIDETALITRIMTRLPDEYKHFGSAWDSTCNDEKTLENLKSRLQSEEDKIKKNEEIRVAFKAAVYKKKNQNKKGKKSVKCFGCGGSGHYVNECKKKLSDNKNRTQCSTCGKYHLGECWAKQELPPCKYCKNTNHPAEKCYFKDEHEKKKAPKTAFISEVLVTEKQEDKTDKIDTEFVVDSGSNEHMSHEIKIMSNVKSCEDTKIKIANGNFLCSNLVGEVESQQVMLTNVLHVPELSRNLLSVNAITEKGGVAIFDKKKIKILKDGDVILEGNKTENGLYIIDIKEDSRKEALLTQKNNTVQWHKRLGHLNFNYLKKIPELCDGVDKIVLDEEMPFCETCIMAKQVRKPFNTVRYRATRPLEIIHTDVCGKVSPPTYFNEEYFLTCLDDYTHFLKVYLLHTKDETEEHIKEYVSESEAHFNLKTEKIRCDRGGEYRSTNFQEWCKNKGIVIDYTIKDSPQLNGKAERINLTIMNKVRAMLFDSQIGNKMWGYAVLTAAYLMNRSPTTAVDVTPAQMWYGRRPNLSRLGIFGSVVFTKCLGYLKKLSVRGEKGILVGYTDNGYVIWNRKTGKFTEARDVEFTHQYEDSKEGNKEEGVNLSVENQFFEENKEREHFDEEERTEVFEEEERTEDSGEEERTEASDEERTEDFNEEEERREDPEADQRPRRQINLPKRYDDYVMLTYKECTEGEDKENWIKAINEEKESLKKNETWTLVDREIAHGKEIVTGKWIFKKKDNGKYKARLVARGCQQDQGKLDFKDIFSSVVQTNSLRFLFALAAQEDLTIMTFDVKTAFLNGELKEEIFMEIPEGYKAPGKICLLKKALYGLKQAPLQWNKKLNEFLKDENLIQLKSDQCVYKANTEKKMYLAVHVDDGILFGEDIHQMKNLLKKLKKNFDITVDEEPSMYLGIEIKRTKEGIYIHQEKYAKEVVKRYKMENSKTVTTPISSQGDTEKNNVTKSDFPYREAIGSLLYLACKTRLDLAFAVNYESRSMSNPNHSDIINLKRTLRYLNSTTGSGIFYPSKKQKQEIIAYCDADFAGDRKDRKSTTGYIFLYNNAPISWCCKKQCVVALSTTEAEYISAAQCCQEMKVLKTFLEELLNENIRMTLCVDNQSAIAMIKSGQMSRRSKHIDVKYHFISDELNQGWFKIQYCVTQDQLADILTKPLQSTIFKRLKQKLMFDRQ